jgi:hypothetical protein
MQNSLVIRTASAMALAIVLAGCSGLLSGKGGVLPSNNAPVGNNLSLPPDLSLKAPGTGPEPYQTASVAEDDDIYGTATAPGLQPAAPGQLTRGQVAARHAANAPKGDIYDEYGISKFKPDGTKKEEWELREELKIAIRKRKQQQNPRYGTVFNMGNIFSDE